MAINGKQVNGWAVYTCAQYPGMSPSNVYGCLDQQTRFPRGFLVRADISGGAVTARDTIFPNSANPRDTSFIAEYPAINVNGTKIAFLRWGRKAWIQSSGDFNTNGDCNSGTSWKPESSAICIINKDGSGFKRLIQVTLSETPVAWGGGDGAEGDQVLDWPAGDWIYYEKPMKTGEIHRVNAVSGTDELVYKYTPTVFIRRFTMSNDARWYAEQHRGGGTTNLGNFSHCRPATGATISSRTGFDTLCGNDGCNIALSPSGNHFVFYLGNHATNYVYQWLHSAGQFHGQDGNPAIVSEGTVSNTQIESWGSFDMTSVDNANGELMRFSSNSDKWYQKEVGWCGQGLLANIKGTSMVLVNWIDQAAILVSNYAMPADCSGDPIRRGASGDFWVNDPTNNPQSAKTELKDGTWAAIGSVSTAMRINRAGEHAGRISVVRGGSTLHIRCDHASGAAAILDIKGRLLGCAAIVRCEASLPAPPSAGAPYLLTITGPDGSHAWSFMIAR
jgi:hypothetical protein